MRLEAQAIWICLVFELVPLFNGLGTPEKLTSVSDGQVQKDAYDEWFRPVAKAALRLTRSGGMANWFAQKSPSTVQQKRVFVIFPFARKGVEYHSSLSKEML